MPPAHPRTQPFQHASRRANGGKPGSAFKLLLAAGVGSLLINCGDKKTDESSGGSTSSRGASDKPGDDDVSAEVDPSESQDVSPGDDKIGGTQDGAEVLDDPDGAAGEVDATTGGAAADDDSAKDDTNSDDDSDDGSSVNDDSDDDTGSDDTDDDTNSDDDSDDGDDTTDDDETVPPSQEDANAYFGGGSRLKPLVYSAEGVALFSGEWFDTELGQRCTFDDVNGDSRCIPASGVLRFEDAECTKPVIRIWGADCFDAHQGLAISVAGGECAAGGIYEPTGDAYVPDQLYATGTDSCIAAIIEAGARYFPAEAVPRASLVSRTHEVRPWAPGMDAWVQVNSDGSWTVTAPSIPGSNVPCAFHDAPEIAGRCIPGPLFPGDWVRFEDDACNDPILDPGLTYACEPPGRAALVFEATEDACANRVTVYSLGELGPVPILRDDGLSCVANGEVEAYPLGPALDPAGLPLLETILVGEGPLKVPFHASGGVPITPDPTHASFVDTRTGAACRPEPFVDDTMRCYPAELYQQGANLNLYSADPQCAGPGIASFQSSSCDSYEPHLVTEFEPECRQPKAVYEGAPMDEDAALYRLAVGANTCDPMVRSESHLYLVAGAKVELPVLGFEARD